MIFIISSSDSLSAIMAISSLSHCLKKGIILNVKHHLFLINVILESPGFFIVMLIVFLLVLIGTLIAMITFKNQVNKFQQEVKKRINYYLVYRINLKLDVVYEFDPKNPRLDRLIPVSQFLKNFHPSEAEKLYQWWEKLLKAKLDTPWIYTTKMTKQKKERNRQIIFEVIKIDEQQQSIHLHRYGLKYLKPSSKKKTNKQLIISTQQAFSIFKKLSPKQGGLISIHMIFPRTGLDEQFKFFYLSQIKEKILPYLTPQILLMDTAADILVLTTNSVDKQNYMEIAQTIFRVVSQYVEVNALESLIKFNLAIIEHKHFPNDLRVLIRKVKELNLIMVKKKLMISTFEKNQPITQSLEKSDSEFAEEFYQKLKFDLAFRPLISIPEVVPFGQQIKLHTPLPTSLTSIELLNEAPMMINYPKEFYRRYLNLIGQVNLQTPEVLLTPFSIAMKISEFLPEIKNWANPKQIIAHLDEYEVKEFAATANSLKTWADPLKLLGVQFALSLDDLVVNMNQDVYNFFDYFILDYRRIMKVEDDQKTSIQMKLVFQNFARFHKPFIVLDSLAESSLEIMPVQHVKIIGADWLMAEQTTLTHPTKRQINRVKNFITKQEKLYGKTN